MPDAPAPLDRAPGCDPAPQDRSRLAWRCRRGRREWDLLLLGWLERHYDSATPGQRAAFAALLELPDPQLEHFLLTAAHPLAADLPSQLPEAHGSSCQRNLPGRAGSNF